VDQTASKRGQNYISLFVDLEESKLLFATRERISEAGLSASGACLLPPGSLMVTTRATLGARAINAVAMTTNQGFRSVVFKKGESVDFYFHLLEKVKPELTRRASGTTFLEIPGSEFARIELPSPPIDEKRAIAAVLDTLDAAVRQAEAIIEKLKQVKQGLLHDLLTRGLDENGEMRPPQSEAPHLYKQSTLGWIPNDWRTARLNSCAAVASGVTVGRNVGGAGTLEVPYLRVANVPDGYLDLDEIKTIRIFASEFPRFKLEYGDVLMNEGGDFDKLGRGTMWEGQIEDCLHQNHVFRVRCDHEKLKSRYLTAYSSSQFGKRYFVHASKQTTNLASINSTQLKAFELRLPPLSEQEAVVLRIGLLDARVAAEQVQSDKWSAAKSGVMNDLLTGRVRVIPLLKQ